MAPASLGQSATFTSSSDTITLASAVTAGASIPATPGPRAPTSSTVSSCSAARAPAPQAYGIAGAFTTGLIAYHDLGTLDYIGVPASQLLIRQSGMYGTLPANTLSLRLCSRTPPAPVPVHSFTLPLLGDGLWTALVFDTAAAALGSSIQSIALYALLDPGYPTIAHRQRDRLRPLATPA